MTEKDFESFQNLTYEKFRQRARDDALSLHEKIGFPDSYREGAEERIFTDIASKLTNLQLRHQVVADVGCGCSGLPRMMAELCRRRDHTLVLIDSEEMLSQLPDAPFQTKIPGYYPSGCSGLFERYTGRVNVVLAYSLLHYVFAEGNVYAFCDRTLSLLAPGGQLLIGDVPNVSKRKRFFGSAAGIRFHQHFTGRHEAPHIEFNVLEAGQIDDSVVLSVLARCRSQGFDAYVVPQSDDLPMANRREDIVVRRP